MSNQSATHSPIEDFGHGVTRQLLYDQHIVIFTRPTSSQAAVDAWFNAVHKTYTEWPSDRPFLGLHDYSVQYSPTPYAKARIGELAVLPKKGYEIYSAVVLPRSFTRSLVVLTMYAMETIKRTDLHQRIFFEKESALLWLKTILDKLTSQPTGTSTTTS